MVLAFRHVAFEPMGRLADVLDARGIPYAYADLWRTPDLPVPLDGVRAVVVMGGPMSVNDPLEWLRREEAYVGEAIARGLPVLGICLGAQMIAKLLGARVAPLPQKEIGWYGVTRTDAGCRDPLFAHFHDEETTFHWHGEGFDLPMGAVLLAASERCPHQAFRVRNLYGVQFHPEVTPQMIAAWCEEDCHCGDLREAEHGIDPNLHAARMREAAEGIFGSWCETFPR